MIFFVVYVSSFDVITGEPALEDLREIQDFRKRAVCLTRDGNMVSVPWIPEFKRGKGI